MQKTNKQKLQRRKPGNNNMTNSNPIGLDATVNTDDQCLEKEKNNEKQY